MENRKVILILGRTGSGKSTLSKSLKTRSHRTITLDPLGEYSGLIFTEWLDLAEYLESFDDVDAAEFDCVCRFHNDDDIDFLFRLVWDLKNILFIVEETEIYLNPKSENKPFMKLVNFGRHNNISLLCVARRIPELNIRFRAQCTSIFSFYQFEPGDLDKLSDYGFNENEILTLKEHEFATWQQGENFDEIAFT